jgi:hypothetical protein
LAWARPLSRPELSALSLVFDVLQIGGMENWRVMEGQPYKVIFHVVAAIERAIAPNTQIFDAILTPFREARTGFVRSESTKRVAACTAFWLGHGQRTQELDRCADAAQRGGCYLPKVDADLDTVAVGVAVSKSMVLAKLLTDRRCSEGWPLAGAKGNR